MRIAPGKVPGVRREGVGLRSSPKGESSTPMLEMWRPTLRSFDTGSSWTRATRWRALGSATIALRKQISSSRSTAGGTWRRRSVSLAESSWGHGSVPGKSSSGSRSRVGSNASRRSETGPAIQRDASRTITDGFPIRASLAKASKVNRSSDTDRGTRRTAIDHSGIGSEDGGTSDHREREGRC